jgi:hypothetical protein
MLVVVHDDSFLKLHREYLQRVVVVAVDGFVNVRIHARLR